MMLFAMKLYGASFFNMSGFSQNSRRYLGVYNIPICFSYFFLPLHSILFHGAYIGSNATALSLEYVLYNNYT